MPDLATLIAPGRSHAAQVTAYWFPPDVAASKGRDAARPPVIQVPDVGIHATLKRLRRPTARGAPR